MKKIEGNKKQVCMKLHKQIYEVLSDEMPNDVIDRYINFEWCNAGTYLGQCILRRNSNVAVVRISSMFDFSQDTVAHEILHALLPFGAKHGPIFKQAMAIINDVLNLHVTVVATKALSQTCKKPATPYKYAIVNKQTGELLMRFKRYCKKITACLYYEATEPDWGYTVISYDEYLKKQADKHTAEKVACAVNDGKTNNNGTEQPAKADDEQQKQGNKGGKKVMRKYEIFRMVQTRIIDDVYDYDEYMDATEQHGYFTVEAPNLFRAVVAARKWETQDYDDAVANGENYYYIDWLEVWEVGDNGMYTGVRRYVFPMRDM